MWNKDEAKIAAILYIADFFGKEYVKNHISGACESYPSDNSDEENSSGGTSSL